MSRSGRSRARCCGCATRAAPGLVERTIRGEQAYLVPRGDGRYVLGATMEERGWDTAPTAGGVYELLRDMSELVPGVLELEIEELIAGPAPGDAGQPAGDRPGALDGLSGRPATTATGSCSTPVTADLVAGALAGEPLPEWAARRRPAPLRGGATHEGPAQRRADASWPTARRSQTALEALDLPGAGRGVAVAVDAEVVPRGAVGRRHELHEGARVEILRAIQGG